MIRVPAAAIDLILSLQCMQIAAAQEDDGRFRFRRRLRDTVLREVKQRLGGWEQQLLEGKAALFIEDHLCNVRDLCVADTVGAGESPAADEAHRSHHPIGGTEGPQEIIDGLGAEDKAQISHILFWFI